MPKDIVTDEYNHLVENVEIVNVRTIAFSFVTHSEHIGKDAADNFALVVDAPQYRVNTIAESRMLICGSKLCAHLKSSASGGNAVDIVAEYEVFYLMKDGGLPPSENVVRLFASRNGVFNAWPFFREFVMNCACRAGWPPITVPLLKLPPFPQATVAETGANIARDPLGDYAANPTTRKSRSKK